MNAKEELLAELTAKLEMYFRDNNYSLESYSTAGILGAITEDWSVEKGRPSSHDHPLYDGPDMMRFKIRTPPRELNDAEKAAKDARSAHYDWVYGKDHSTAPPKSVSTIELLRQDVWWTHERKLVDLTPGERLKALRFFKATAGKLRDHAAFRYASCPDDGVMEEFLLGDPWEDFLSKEPQVVELLRLIKRDEKRPCGFRWGDQEGVGDEACSMSGDYRHDCGRRHSHRKPHRCRMCQNERDRTIEDTPPPADAKMSDVLEQNVWWVTRKGEQIKLADMKPSHRENTLNYLKRNARQIVDSAYGGYMIDAPDEVQRAFEGGDPWVILSESPLVTRLAALVTNDKMTPEEANSAEGKCGDE